MKRSIVASGIVALGLVASACGGGASSVDTSSGTPDKGHILRDMFQGSDILDPVRDTSPCSTGALQTVYDVLIRTNQDGTHSPGLAKSWKTPDSKTLEFVLQDGVKFQDGTPFNAQAVADHIKRAQADKRSTLTAELDVIKSIEIVDDVTLVLHLSEPRAGILLSSFSGYAGMVPSPTAVKDAGDKYGVDDKVVGAGPYKVESHVPGTMLKVRAWDGYWQPKTRMLGGVDFDTASGNLTGQVITQRVASKALDLASIKDDARDYAKKTQGVELAESPSDQFVELFIDYGVKPFDDIKVRQALEHALDRKVLAKVLSNGTGTAAYQPVPPNQAAHSKSANDLYPYDPTKAKKLLADAGYPNGIDFKVAEINHEYYKRVSEAVQSMLKKSGINIELVPINPVEINNILYVTKEHSAAITAYTGSRDPGKTLELKFGTKGNNNPSHTTTPGLDELLAEGAASTKPAGRDAAYKKAGQKVMENALSIPIFFNAGTVIHSPKVKNIEAGVTTCEMGRYLVGEPNVFVSK